MDIECQQAFTSLKISLSTTLVLSRPTSEEPMYFYMVVYEEVVNVILVRGLGDQQSYGLFHLPTLGWPRYMVLKHRKSSISLSNNIQKAMTLFLSTHYSHYDWSTIIVTPSLARSSQNIDERVHSNVKGQSFLWIPKRSEGTTVLRFHSRNNPMHTKYDTCMNNIHKWVVHQSRNWL